MKLFFAAFKLLLFPPYKHSTVKIDMVKGRYCTKLKLALVKPF